MSAELRQEGGRLFPDQSVACRTHVAGSGCCLPRAVGLCLSVSTQCGPPMLPIFPPSTLASESSPEAGGNECQCQRWGVPAAGGEFDLRGELYLRSQFWKTGAYLDYGGG